MEELKAALIQSIYLCSQKVFPPFSSLRFDALLGLTVNEQSCLSLQVEGLVGLPSEIISVFSRCTAYTELLKSEVAKAIIADCWKFIQDMRKLEVEGMISIILDNSQIIFLKLDHSANKRTVPKPVFPTLSQITNDLNLSEILSKVDVPDPAIGQDHVDEEIFQAVTDFPDVLTPNMEVEPATRVDSDMCEDSMTDVLEQAVLPEEDSYMKADLEKYIPGQKFLSNNEVLKTFVLVTADKEGMVAMSDQHQETTLNAPLTPQQTTVNTPLTPQPTNEVKMLQTTIEEEIDVMKERKRHTHYQRINGKQICPICQRRFPIRANMAAHIRTHTGVKPFSCEHCPYKACTRNSLKRHTRRRHVEAAKFECKVCGKMLRTQDLLKDHMNKHTGDTPYKCEMCERKSFSSKHSLQGHVELFHVKKLRCKFCRYLLPNDEKLREHENGHETGDIEEKFKITAKRQARFRLKKRENKRRKREIQKKLGLQNDKPKNTDLTKLKPRKPRRGVNKDEPCAVFVCDECNEKFNSAGDLMKHLIGHKEENIKKEQHVE